MVYDHDAKGLETNLTDAQHQHSTLIFSALHIHISEQDCIIGGPFSTAYNSVGMADFMLKLYDDPVFIERVLDLATEHCRRFVEGVCR